MMKYLFGGKTCCPMAQKKSAQVVDGKLILSCLSARNPVVWQMDLADVRASALEVVSDEKDATFTLCLRSPDKKDTDVAVFDTREEAVSCLKDASYALENATGHIVRAANANTVSAVDYGAGRKKAPWGWIIFWIVALFILVVVLNGMRQGLPTTAGSSYQSPPSANESGVPLSADDFLRGR